MKDLHGELKGLRATERAQLERLASKRCNPREFVSAELARRAATLSAQLGVQLALLIARDGSIAYLVVGTKDRVYLPDLGRFRLDAARLRRLRMVLFMPGTTTAFHRPDSILSRKDQQRSLSVRRNNDAVESPVLPADILTDLEKLRLDSVLGVAVDARGQAGSASLAYLSAPELLRTTSGSALQECAIRFHHVRTVFDLDLDFESFISEVEENLTTRSTRTFETATDRAVLVGAYTGSAKDAQESMEELAELARSADISIADTIIQRRRSLDPKTVIGRGKLEELVLHCLALGADLVIFDQELSPGQLRSVTNSTELRVLDRSMLILDIFAQRAKSSEGRLQVELAQLKYSLPRLTERDTGLSRLSGGIGGRGPGETKLEIGRRRARDRIADLEKRIERLAMQRAVRRERRQSRGVPVVAIVGYTNAGKSTLLNALTKGEVIAESKMFATLDPSSRRMRFPNEREVIFVDTVGFIRELPRELVTAFRATLEEVGEADLLLHVVDSSDREVRRRIEVVEETLTSLGANEKPKLLVLNKTDLLGELEVKSLQHALGGIPISAESRAGLAELIATVQDTLSKTFQGQDPGRFTETLPW